MSVQNGEKTQKHDRSKHLELRNALPEDVLHTSLSATGVVTLLRVLLLSLVS